MNDVIFTGDKISFQKVLRLPDGSVPLLYTLKAAIISACGTRRLSSDITQSASATGADWATGLVTIEFEQADTSTVSHQGPAFIEIQNTTLEGFDQSARLPVDVNTGLVA